MKKWMEKLGPQGFQLAVVVVFLIVILFLFGGEIFHQKTNTEPIEKNLKEISIPDEYIKHQDVEPNWYNPRNRLITICTLDSLANENVLIWKDNPSDSTKADAVLILRRYVEFTPNLVYPLVGEPINSEKQMLSECDKERIKDLQSLRAMIFWRLEFAKENNVITLSEYEEFINLLISSCPAVILTAILMDSNTSMISENEEILKNAMRNAIAGRFIYECSLILEHYDELKDLSWYPSFAESAVQTLLERSPERLLLLQQQVLSVRGGVEAIASAQRLIASR